MLGLNMASELDIFNFIIGGITVVVIARVVKKYNTKAGAVIWSLPYTLLPVIFIMWCEKYENKKIAKLGLNSSYSIVLLFTFLYVFYYTLTYLGEYTYGTFIALFVALTVWFIAAYLFYYYV